MAITKEELPMMRYENLNKSFINGEWVEGRSDQTYDIVNPYDHSVVTTVRLATSQQLHEPLTWRSRRKRNGPNLPPMKGRRSFTRRQSI